TWSPVAPMALHRWYPAITELGDGRVLAMSGQSSGGIFANTPELYDPVSNQWTSMAVNTSDVQEIQYPFTTQLPNGRVFVMANSTGVTRLLDVNAQTWTQAAPQTNLVRSGSAIMYRPGRILFTGGDHGYWSEQNA